MTNDLNELRDHLFSTLRELRNKENPLELDRARAISQVAGTLIDSARVEVEFLRATGRSDGTKFLTNDVEEQPLPAGIVSVRRHRLK